MIRLFLVLCFLSSTVVWTAAGQHEQAGALGGLVYSDTLQVSEDNAYRLRSFVIPGSLTIRAGGVELAASDYVLDDRFGLLSITDLPDSISTIIVAYSALNLDLQDAYRNSFVKEPASADSTGYFASLPGAAPQPESQEDFFGASKLSRSGSISRGVIAGNNRDVTIESGLRMQLSGEVVEGVNIRAALTDENTPILPEGTTQRLQELDKVFIEVSTEKAVATLGDFQMEMDGSTFGKFSRKLQGVSVEGTLPGTPAGVFGGGIAKVAGATSRGIFRSQPVQILEGVQGPYRLEGQFGERFIILVPGSEVVYLDGVRLTRGEQNDYVVDYATAEITFTARRIIGADRRVVVEFQYSTNQFTRTLLAAEGESGFWRIPGTDRTRGMFGVTVLREADSRQFAQEFGLSTADSLLLSLSGDNVASRSGAELVEYDPEALFVQYRQEVIDNGTVTDTIFVALDEAPADSVPVYRVQFSRVGTGLGDYVRRSQLVNGIQYEYAGPGQGEYAPVRLLPRPKRQQLVDFYGTVEPVKGLVVRGEFARSDNDLNRLSPLDSDDDGGSAFTGSARLVPTQIVVGGRDLGKVSAEFNHTSRSANFVSFNRTRDVEFGRVWNLSSINSNPTGAILEGLGDDLTEASLRYALVDSTYIEAGFGQLRVGDAISADRFRMQTYISPTRLPVFNYTLDRVDTEDLPNDITGAWLRQKAVLRKVFTGFMPFVEVEHERREQRRLRSDSLTATAFEFIEVRPGVRKQGETYSFGGTIEYRQDNYPIGNALHDAGHSWTMQSSATLKPSADFDTEVVLGIRSVSATEAARVNLQRESQRSVVLRNSGSVRRLSRAIRASWVYDARTERTPRLQEIYIRTGPELGQYVWVDANGDNVVQIDEFLLETTPNEGNYVKSFIPSDSLFSIIGLQTRARLDIDPSRALDNDGSTLERVLGSMSTRTILDVTEKNSTQRLTDVYLLRLGTFRDPNLTLSGRVSVRQDLFLFKNNRRYGGDVTFNRVRSLNNLAAGLETKFVNRWQASVRAAAGEQWTTRLTGAIGTDRTTNETFESRNFDIRSNEISPEVTYAPSRVLQFNLRPELSRKDDAPRGRSSSVLKLPLEVRYTRPSKYQVFSLFELAEVSLDGDATGLAGFELTDGRGAGRSYLWSVNGQYSFNQFLRAVVSYDGRLPSVGKAVHTVRMQLSAVF